MNGWIGKSIEELPTPCLVVDLAVFEKNLHAMQHSVSATGKRLRPHAKTHKCLTIARQQLDLGAVGVCAAKLSEAESLVEGGVGDVLLTGPVVGPHAHDRLLAAREKSSSLIVTLDNFENALAISRKLHDHGLVLHCLADLDPEFGRTGHPLAGGVDFLLRLRDLPRLELRGIQAYAGNLQHVLSFRERRELVRRALDSAGQCLEAARARGLALPVFSGGGTGTSAFDLAHPLVTEIQAGSYVFMDGEYFDIAWGEAGADRPPFVQSLFVLTSVVSANHPDHVTLDAGLKALYRDGGIPRPAGNFAGAEYDWFGDEYGRLTCPPGLPLPRLGERLRIAPSHIDPTVNLFDRYFVTRDETVEAVWPIELRGCCH